MLHPNGKWIYCNNEISNRIDLLLWDAKAGTLTLKSSLSTLPADAPPKCRTADIVLSPDLRFLYGSNRGLESFVVWAVQHDGTLQQIQFLQSEGVENRHILLDATGKWLIAANARSNDIAVLPRATQKPACWARAAQQHQAARRVLCAVCVSRMFLRRLSIERMTAAGHTVPCPIAQIDNYAMRNFTNDAVFDDTLPIADGVLEAGLRVPADLLQQRMEQWFRRKGYLATHETLRVQELPRGQEGKDRTTMENACTLRRDFVATASSRCGSDACTTRTQAHRQASAC